MFGTRKCDAEGTHLSRFLLPAPGRKSITGEALGCHQSGTTFLANVSSRTAVDSGKRCTIYILRDATMRMETHCQLEQENADLRALVRRLQSRREEERSSLAREIHDELAQDLTCLKIDAIWCRHEVANLSPDKRVRTISDRLESMAREINDAIAIVQRIATELHPALLDHFGLGAAIEWEAREFEKRARIPCRVLLPATEPDTSPDGAIALYRIVQESLNNIVRHAEATGVEIRLCFETTNFILAIRDDGRGISPHALRSGISPGLLGMREWARALGGEFEITGSPGVGTTVTVRLPTRTSLPSPTLR